MARSWLLGTLMMTRILVLARALRSSGSASYKRMWFIFWVWRNLTRSGGGRSEETSVPMLNPTNGSLSCSWILFSCDKGHDFAARR